MSKVNYTIKKEPNWLLEVAQCILTKDKATEVKHLENCSRFGMNSKDMENYLSKVMMFKDNILNEINPILNKYPDLEFLFELTDFEKESSPIVIGIIYASNKYLEKVDGKPHINEIINQTFEIILEEILDNINQKEFNITNISYLVDLLHNVNL
ncbi:MAG: hypothetical protein K0S61_4215, partial [Anaerocolumna sp.]|nr:hypothetical protein [Anaerocolumna sp.]